MKVVIVGAGEVGFHIAGHLTVEKKDVVVVDKNPEALVRVSEKLDVQTIEGSGSSPDVLEEAGVRDAEILLAVTNSDEVNLAACLMTNILAPGTRKLARLRSAEFDAYHEHFKTHAPHIDTVINPEIEVVRTIRRLMNVPGAVDVAEFAEGRVRFVGIKLDPSARVAGARLAELGQRIGGARPLIAAVIRDEELIIPRGDDRLRPGDEVYFISEASRLIETLAMFDKQVEPVNRVLIMGGGSVGYRLAKDLDDTDTYVKIIDKNPARCNILAERLNKAIVLQGDGSDQSLLAEENIGDMDMAVALTNDEETNIIASLLAKRMGAKKVITRVSKFSHFNLLGAIGIEKVVSSRLSAINTILQHIRSGRVLSAIFIKGEQAEVIEAEAMETSDIVGKPLKRIRLPKGVLVASVIRGDEVIIPSGDTIIEAGDHTIIFARREAISKMEKILVVKLEYV